MHRLICDVSVSASEAFPAVLKIMEEVGYQLDGFKQVNRLLELFTEMSNHTRMPSNRGFTPKEIMQKMGGALKQIEFGSGILQLIQQGEIDGNELKRSIVGEGSIPLEMRASLLRNVDRAMEKRRKRDEK